MPAYNAGILVNLAVANTRYNLKTLMQAIDTSFLGVINYLQLFSPFVNSGAIIYVGDSLVTSSRYGFLLAVGGYSERIAPSPWLISLAEIYITADTNNSKLAVDAALMQQGVY